MTIDEIIITVVDVALWASFILSAGFLLYGLIRNNIKSLKVGAVLFFTAIILGFVFLLMVSPIPPID